jgi:hypothetical protein
MNPEQQMAEEATGIVSRGPLRLFRADTEEEIDATTARGLLLSGVGVVCPGAGAGGYKDLCGMLELGPASVYDNSSSAADWSFWLPEFWKMLFQTNRFPFHGFLYTVGEPEPWILESLESSMPADDGSCTLVCTACGETLIGDRAVVYTTCLSCVEDAYPDGWTCCGCGAEFRDRMPAKIDGGTLCPECV